MSRGCEAACTALLQTGPGALFDVHGQRLNAQQTVSEAGVCFGYALTLQVRPTAVANTTDAFAVILGDSSVATLGSPSCSGDENVKQILS